MAVDANFVEALFEDLKPDDPFLPPKPWESISSESGVARTLNSASQRFYDTSAVSEAIMVRLALNALQGSEVAVSSIEKLSASFCSEPADRTFHEIPSLWTRTASTCALGKMLQDIGFIGSLVFLLDKFVNYFTDLASDVGVRRDEVAEGEDGEGDGVKKLLHCGLVNQAFAVAVRKVLGGYICALETIGASGTLRRSGKGVKKDHDLVAGSGCLRSVVHSEITLLEVYIHTQELRIKIQSLANICKIYDVLDISSPSFSGGAIEKATLDFSYFPRGARLLSFLYSELEVCEPAHATMLKFLFQRSCEPYFRFIRSWIFEAKISDPYNEFIVECVENKPSLFYNKIGLFCDLPLVTVRERDGVSVPCFLKTISTPLFRAGQQLQVVRKLLELCSFSNSGFLYEDIVPCFTSGLPSSTSHLNFKKRDLESMVNTRNSIYELLQSKLEKFPMKLDLRYHQVVTQSAMSVSDRLQNDQNLSAMDHLSPSKCKRDIDMVIDDQDANSPRSSNELSSLSDPLNSSDWSSSSCCDDDSQAGEFTETPITHLDPEQKYLSSLRFSSTIPTECCFGKSSLREISSASETRPQLDTITIKDVDVACLHPDNSKETYLKSIINSSENPTSSWMPRNYRDTKHWDMCSPLTLLNDRKENYQKEEDPSTQELPESKIFDIACYLAEDHTKQDAIEEGIRTSKSWTLKSQKNHLSMNPMLRKRLHLGNCCKPGEISFTEDKGFLPFFDFSNVESPFKVVDEKAASRIRHKNGSDSACVMDSHAAATDLGTGYSHVPEISKSEIIKNSSSIIPPRESSSNSPGDNLDAISGGTSWEKLLAIYSTSTTLGDERWKQTSPDGFDVPISFIIDKCLLQEIKLQYKYISKLTIKLLREGFDLQEHLMALRRYHLMEVADWADLFIMSLWHHKWCLTEGERRIPQIQGLMEVSIQRSSCERDPLKDRLFMFAKRQTTSSLSVSAVGVHSFEFLGLGYRVDWPVSVILTSGALSVYSQIFSFLIQVKLANFALTDIWCSLKGRKHVIRDSRPPERKTQDFSIMMNLRHQVNYFVNSLQQYLMSQLSHVSWSRFLKSLKYKVKDMMDFESVHMAYLEDLLQICFLSDETKTVATVVANILQCALDFRSCLMDRSSNINDSSQLNISQIMSIKNTFDTNLKELYVCHLKSHRHAEYGLSHLWRVLNYNKYYASAI